MQHKCTYNIFSGHDSRPSGRSRFIQWLQISGNGWYLSRTGTGKIE